MRLALAVSLVVWAGAGAAQQVDCANAQTQADMNWCSAEELAKADAELNRIWPQVRTWAKDTDSFLSEGDFADFATADESLLKAQRAWIDYRDGHCATEGAKYAGGSIMPLIVNSCLAALTERRTQELKALMEDG